MGAPDTGGTAQEQDNEHAPVRGPVVHVCAASEEQAVLHALVKHLTGIDVTHTHQIEAGTTTAAERRTLLDAARVIVLLVSADFVASREDAEDAARALERHKEQDALLVPVLCRPYTWEVLPYAHLLALPRDGRPIILERKLGEEADPERPARVIEQVRREDALAEVAREIRALVAGPAAAGAACPFPGLTFFDEDHTLDFFGRDAQIGEALAKLAEPRPLLRWLQIDGPSGAGKSSFARAGIVPAVRAGKLVGGPKTWVTAVLRPGHDPIASLAKALVKHAKPPLDVKRSLDALARELRSSPTALASLLHEVAPDDQGVLLLVDQLEETFTHAGADDTIVRQFDALLAAALADRELPFLLVTTIRSDFVARMSDLPALEAKLPTQAVRYYLRSMDEAGLRAAIERPVQRAGLTYEPGLVDRIVGDARSSRGALPLVAHVLETLWTQRAGRMLTTAAYDLVGGVGGALTKSADALIGTLDADGRERARKLLLRLVKIGRGSEDTRQTASREAALSAAGRGVESERLLARLSGGRAMGHRGHHDAPGRLVVVSGEDSDAGGERVDLVHEALIQRWPTLRAWIKEAREQLELRDDVEEAARIWKASGAAEDGLPKGALLGRFRSAERPALQKGARRYLDAAEEAEQRAEGEKRAQEEEKRKAAEERARFQRRVIVGLVGFVVALVIAAVGLAWQSNEAKDSARRAERQTKLAEARRLAALAAGAGAQHLPPRQLLLAAEGRAAARAAEVPFLVEVDQALLDAVTSTGGVPLTGHEGKVTAVAFSPDGQHIVTASSDNTVWVWNADGMGKPLVLRRHESGVNSVAFSPDGQRIVTALWNKTVRVWNADGTGKALVLLGHEDRVSSAAFSPDGQRIVTASSDKTVRVWNADGMGEPLVLRGHEALVWSAEFSPEGQRIVTASNDKRVLVWNADGTGETLVLLGHDAPVSSAAFSPDGQRIVTASWDKTARVWNADGTGKSLVLRGHENGVRSAAFSPEGQRIVTASDDRTVRVWNADGTGEPLVLRGHESFVRSAAFSPDGKRIITACGDGTARVWNADGAGEPLVLRGYESLVWSAAFSPDGKRIVTASGDKTAHVWSANGVGGPLVLRGHEARVSNAAFSPDGKRIVTASDDKTVRVWNADGTGEPLVLRGHEDDVWSAAFSPDGKRIVTASGDKTVRVWNADGTGEPLVLRGHEDDVRSAAFSPDGKRIVTASDDKTVRVWNTNEDFLAKTACALAGRNFTGEEWRHFFGDAPYRKTCEQWPAAPDAGSATGVSPALLRSSGSAPDAGSSPSLPAVPQNP